MKQLSNEEKALEIANKQNQYYGNTFYKIRKEYLSAPECFKSAMEMARWKDEQFAQEKQNLLDKACEWLKNNMYEGTCEQILSNKTYPFMRDFIEEFRKAMKGGDCDNK